MMHPTTLSCGARTLNLSAPVVMGILNVTPDSFSDGGRYTERDAALRQAEQMLRDGGPRAADWRDHIASSMKRNRRYRRASFAAAA